MHLTEIDLYAYFRLFHPELASFSLDHIGRTFVGQGKTGMSTDELISIMRQPEPAAYARAGSYSLRDSVLLRELWQLLPIVANLQRLSDACGLSFTDLLRARPEAIVARLAYLIDPSTAYQPYKIRARDTHPVPAAGLFRDMVFYDYSELYRMALLNSPDPFTRQLGQALIGFPPVCLVAAYYSPYVQMVPPIDLGFGGSGVIRVGSWFCIGPAGLPLPICHRFAYVLSLGGSSYLAQTQEGQRHAYGTAWICKTPFPLVEELVQGYLSGTVSACPVVTAADWPKLVCTTVLRGGSHSNLSRHPDLVEQYAQPIVTWTKVSWVQTPQGRRLLDDTPPTPDLAYYQGRLGRYWTELASLGGKARPINPATSPRLTGLTLEVDRPA